MENGGNLKNTKDIPPPGNGSIVSYPHFPFKPFGEPKNNEKMPLNPNKL
jgi:hypothetical protein